MAGRRKIDGSENRFHERIVRHGNGGEVRIDRGSIDDPRQTAPRPLPDSTHRLPSGADRPGPGYGFVTSSVGRGSSVVGSGRYRRSSVRRFRASARPAVISFGVDSHRAAKRRHSAFRSPAS